MTRGRRRLPSMAAVRRSKIMRALELSVIDAGGTKEDMNLIESDVGLRRKIASLIVGNATPIFFPRHASTRLEANRSRPSLQHRSGRRHRIG